MTQPFVAVHVGAGFHSDANGKELRALCRRACKKAMEALIKGTTSSEAAIVAVTILENSSQTNAAIGSNLSLSGTVECDASIMDGQGNFGAVGAVKGVVNPIILAHTLLKESSQGCLPLGRVPPLVLVGSGASAWARKHHIATCPSDDLITDRARAVYLDHMARLEGVTQEVESNGCISDRMGDGLVSHGVGKKHPNRDTETHGVDEALFSHGVGRKHPHQDAAIGDGNSKRQKSLEDVDSLVTPCFSNPLSSTTPYQPPLDTVGAVCLDLKGRVAAGVSSGGISLKSPGRVGQAAMFGCGCWADDEVGGNSRAVACSTSGTGEYIIKTSLAKECAQAVTDSTLQNAFDKHFLNSKRLKNVDQKLAGVIVLNFTSDDVLHFSWGHTTESMCIGFMAGNHKEPTAIISKMDNPELSGTVSHVQALRIHS